ncbi:hypothetical protein AK830_g1389 [Neonectria ditissima]|uniref:Cytochrome b5 heme-binding domain-containing protein n=1 Tax=Neonectria ditissima TaxID=78410 RepID=A0A0P7BEX4_9HYPO|nr:hypothetical protein AK830_g1389 [Neonectria ditissima]
MASATELTYQEVSGHSSKKDLYVVIHDKVYNCTNFIDEHPGGEEVMLDLAGTDATEAFEDVGHSDEAREILDTLFTADIKRVPGDQAPKVHQSAPEPVAKPSSGMSTVLYAIVITGGIAAAFLYTYLQEQKNIVMPEEA